MSDDTPLIALTERAAAHFRELMQHYGLDPADMLLRVGMKRGGGYFVDLTDKEWKNHQRCDSQGLGMLISKRDAKRMQGTTIDYRVEEDEAGLVFDNPRDL